MTGLVPRLYVLQRVEIDNGTLAACPNGSFAYTPNPGLIGTDQFTYNARDDSFNLAGGAVVTIEVFDPDQAGASVITTVDGSGIVVGNASLPAGRTPLGIGLSRCRTAEVSRWCNSCGACSTARRK